MTLSLTERVNRIGSKGLSTQRSFSSAWSQLVGTLATRDVNLTDNKYSVALAYVFIEPVRTCIDLYAQQIPQIPYEIKYNITHDRANDKTVASSEDVGVARLPIMEIFNQHRRDYYISFFEALTYETMLYSAVAVELLRPENETLAMIAREHNRATGLKVLRGLGLSVQAFSGAIQWFQYNDDTGSCMLSPNDVAYDKGYNPFDDYRAVPLLYSVLDDLNIFNKLRRFLMRFLDKADRPDVIAWFKEGSYSANTAALEKFDENLRRYAQSAANLFTSNIPLEVTAVPAGEANDQMQVDEATKNSIYAAFGVPQALVGNNQATTYQEGNHAYANWIRVKVKPLLSTIEDFINDNLLERFGLDRHYRFEFDTSKYEFVTEDDKVAIDVANSKLDSGGYTYKQWADELGIDYDESRANWIKVEGIPVPPEALNELWKYKWQAPASEQYAQAQLTDMQSTQPVAPEIAPSADVPLLETGTIADDTTVTESELPGQSAVELSADVSELDDGEPVMVTLTMQDSTDGKRITYTTTSDKVVLKTVDNGTAFAYMPLFSNRDVLKVQNTLKRMLPDKRIEWQDPKTFHVTLCYGELSDKAISSFASLPIEAMEVTPTKITYFDTPDGKALHIALDTSKGTTENQINVHQQFWKVGQVIDDDFFEEEQWNPHITLAYVPNDIDLFSIPSPIMDFTISADKVIIGRDDYEPVLSLSVNKSIQITDDHEAHIKSFAPRHESRAKELSAYKTVAFARNKAFSIKRVQGFELEWLAGDIGDVLSKELLDSNGDKSLIEAAFKSAESAIEMYHKRFEKTLSETKTNFVEDFASIMRKSLEPDNNYGRVQMSSGIRSIIRRYGTQAYKDGLVEGGDFDAELDDSDMDTIASLVAEQSAYVSNLGDKIFKQGSVSEAMAILKPDMWFAKSIRPFYEAGLLAISGNGMYEFMGHDGNESCETCIKLKGQRHRLKQWARRGLRPGIDGDNYICGGFNCEHELRRVFAQQRGNWLA